ncbi:MAG: hypothetical protein IJ374_05185 [Lachnospiraceae bacterium]|nr:hypothetical protein [Lachnospiraceae bacterium]
MLNHLCPGCGHHCYLDEPHCARGAEFAKTGVLPPRVKKPDGAHGGKKPSEKKRMYLALEPDSKLAWNIREMGQKISEWEAAAQSGEVCPTHCEMFEGLREEDRKALLMLLEKVKHNWRDLEREKTVSREMDQSAVK